MYLKRLDIQGFKTFASRTVFEFRPGITAVVGPNGSGKSNFADCVRWALGEQSLTTLRCKRTEELLFAGGPRRPPAGFAEVSLTIDNSDRLLPLDFDEVMLTRRATRAGDNEYFINRARVRLRDVQEAVEPLGGSYTIVNQGLVDAALTLRPEERRRLFEDAAEIGGFELRKAEAERRLRETDGNLQRLADLLGELEPRLRLLKRQAGQARQHAELSAELHGLQQQHYGALWQAAQRAAAASEAAQQRLEVELAQARAAQAAASRELQRLRDHLREGREQLSTLHQASAALHARAEAAQRELAVGGERAAALTRRGDDLSRAQQDLALRESEAAREQLASQAAVAAAEAYLSERRERLRASEDELAAAEAERKLLAREVAAAEELALKASTRASEARAQADQVESQRARLLRDRAELDAGLAQAEERLGQARAQHEQAQAALAVAEAAASAAASAESQARAASDVARNERAAADEQRSAARRALADAEAQLDSLSRLARSYAGTFAGVRAAMQWAERASRGGFALVGAIIRTPPEIETAVEVALGSRLQNIVVEVWADAEAAIAELRRSGAGRATFLPLDSLRSQRMENAELRVEKSNSADDDRGSQFSILNSQLPVLGIAADLVDYEPRYEAVARQLLGRVLIVADMATARAELRRLSGGWTIVTLGGEQISSGGAVTGGAPTKESGTLRRERELRELPARVAAARAAVEAAEAQRAAVEARIGALGQELRAAEGHAREASRQHETVRTSLDAAARRLAGAAQERDWQAGRRSRIEVDLGGLDEQQARARVTRVEVEAQAQASGERLNKLRARREAEREVSRAAQDRLAELRGATTGAEAQLKAERSLLAAHSQSAERLAVQAASIARDTASLHDERQRLSAARDGLEASHQLLLAEIDALRTQIEPVEAMVQAHEVDLAALEVAEQQATAGLLLGETAYNQARLAAQRAADRQESIYERAVAEGVDLEGDTAGDGDTAEDGGRRTVDGASSSSPELPEATTVHRPPSTVQAEIDALKAKILRLGAVNPLALEEYEESAERQHYLGGQINDLRQAGATLRELIGELEGAMRARFSATFSAVAAEFERGFTRLFGGGSASLQLVGTGASQREDEEGAEQASPRSFGVDIVARPPGKRAQNISLLSGGERTLTAAALLFAILTVNPSPFCILDEVDAALDESNVGRFREALAALTDTTQFIVVTHNRGTIEAADTLYGVSMGDDGASKLLSLRVEEYANANPL